MRLAKVAIPLILAGMVLGLCLSSVRMFAFMQRDYNHLPPAQAFEYFFQRPLPADVRELAAAGESWMGGSNVWLRFRASPETLRSLTVGVTKTDPWKRGEGSIRDDASTLIRYDVLDRTGWNAVWKLRKMDYYTTGGEQFHTEFVIDHETGTVYAFHLSN
jgi:hypothetical protein